ncbi:MAG: DNA translocase FtsK, partial [Anaerolineae bacterium]
MAQDKPVKPAARSGDVNDTSVGTGAKTPPPSPPAKTGGTPSAAKTNGTKELPLAGTPTSPNKFANAEKYTVKPEFWDAILDLIPPWGDEIAAILLIVFGVVSFLSVINATSDTTIAAAWSKALSGMFGWGSTVICIGIFMLGIIILLPKLGVVIRFPTRRIMALEFAFLSVLALLHLSAGDQELRALARMGRGGGQMGWALTAPLINLFGSALTLFFYSVVLVIAIAVVIGIEREQVERFLTHNIETLRAYGAAKRPPLPPKPSRTFQRIGSLDEALNTKPAVIEDPSGQLVVGVQSALNAQRVRVHSIVRVRPDLENIPPSVRASLSEPQPSADKKPDAKPAEAKSPEAKIADAAELAALMARKEAKPLEGIGTIKGKRVKGEPVLVERPDGRMKRYYTVDNMKEPKLVLKRDAEVPPIDLLRDVEISLPDETEINNNVVLIENTLLEFDIDVDVVDVKVGPTVTQYAVQPFKEGQNPESGELSASGRTRVNKIASLANDLALSLSAKRLRLEAPVPGHTYIGVEVPNRNPSTVALRSVYESKGFQEASQKKKSPL